MHELIVPKLGQSTTEVEILGWSASVGDHVSVGDPIVEVETEKLTASLEADAAGVVTEILAEVGDMVDVGAAICRIETGQAAA